jgi:hypothetical protein
MTILFSARFSGCFLGNLGGHLRRAPPGGASRRCGWAERLWRLFFWGRAHPLVGRQRGSLPAAIVKSCISGDFHLTFARVSISLETSSKNWFLNCNCSGRKKLTVNAQVTRRKPNFMLNSDCGGRVAFVPGVKQGDARPGVGWGGPRVDPDFADRAERVGPDAAVGVSGPHSPLCGRSVS